MNSILATGEIAGLFQKDERDGMCGEVRNDFVKDYPQAEENLVNMYAYSGQNGTQGSNES